MKKLKTVAKNAASDISKSIDADLSKEELDKITAIIAEAMEKTVNKVSKRNMDLCTEQVNPNTDLAHQIQKEIKRKQQAIITNLSSLR